MGLVFAVVVLAVGCLLGSRDWGEGGGGSVPAAAVPVAEGVFAVRARIDVPDGKAWYPGILKPGDSAMVCRQCFGSEVLRTSKYQVYLPPSRWIPALAGTPLPHGAVEFGDDGGELYLVRTQLASGGDYAYGVLSQANQVPYVYSGKIWAPVPECEVLCAVVR